MMIVTPGSFARPNLFVEKNKMLKNCIGALSLLIPLWGCSSGEAEASSDGGTEAGVGGSAAGGNADGAGGSGSESGGATAATGGAEAGTGGAALGSGGTDSSSGGTEGSGGSDAACVDTGADSKLSFFVTSLHHLVELSGSEDGFGGNLRYGNAATGLEGADAICQEIATRVCHGGKTWKAFLSTSAVDAIDRVGSGPWYDYAGQLVAENTAGLVSGDRPSGGCCDLGVYDELGVFHDGSTDVNSDGLDDDDHDVLTGSNSEGRYSGFSCEDWTSTTAEGEATGGGRPGGGGGNTGPMIGHMWPAMSGQSYVSAHSAPGCGAGINLVQNGSGSIPTVGDAGGYGAIYCFAQ